MKEIVRRTITGDAVLKMDVAKVVAISFAEVGAQGTPNSVAVISDRGNEISVERGGFSFEFRGVCYPGAVAIETLEAKFPFLAQFRGTTIDTICRGHFTVPGGEWIHFDETFGNHFFVRTELADQFLKGIKCCPRKWWLDVVLELLKGAEFGDRVEMVAGRNDAVLGAVVGDLVGSRFEFHNWKSKDFKFLVSRDEKDARHCYFTDDTVMTLAIAEAILMWKHYGIETDEEFSRWAIKFMRRFGSRYPRAGYGGSFRRWLAELSPKPYNSWGNGAAMRVSARGCASLSLDEVKRMSAAVTRVTHNHPEGLKGAEATAVAVCLARQGKSKDEIRAVVVRDYYPIDFTLDEIRDNYRFDVSCQGSVPQALEAFFESDSFEDAIRNAISIGGDSDTLGAICGAVAGAYYGVPDEIRDKAMTFLPQDLRGALVGAESRLGAAGL